MRALQLILALALATTAGAFTRPAEVHDCPMPKSPAKDWRTFSMFKGAYDFEEFSLAPGSFVRDSSTGNNDLDASGGWDHSTQRTLVREKCRSFYSNSLVGALNCLSPQCNEADFCPINSSFTAGCWLFPFDSFPTERYHLVTLATGGAAGFRLGWKQSIGSVGNLLFDIKRNSAAADHNLLNFATLPTDTWYHHVGRYFYDGTASSTMYQVINGVQDANTTTNLPITECDDFAIGPGAFLSTVQGYLDECFYADCALDNLSICRIAVCGISGAGCSCDEVNPEDYDWRPLHSSAGGPINCTMPPCDDNPQCMTTTTTSTSTSSSTSTVTSTTSTSTSSTTSTSAPFAEDWSDEANLVAHWNMNDTLTGFNPSMTDINTTHPLGNTTTYTNDTGANTFESNHGNGLISTNTFSCQANGTCGTNNADFDFGTGTGSFTCYQFFRPEDPGGPSDPASPVFFFGTVAGGLGSGGWQAMREAGPLWTFYVNTNGGSPTSVAATTEATQNARALVVVERIVSSGDIRISVNGESWVSVPFSGASDIPFPTADFSFAGNGTHDFGGCWNGAMALEDVRHLAICGITGVDCTCSGATYLTAPRASGNGGLITDSATACNAASPTFE